VDAEVIVAGARPVEDLTPDGDGVAVRLADGAPVRMVRAAYLIGHRHPVRVRAATAGWSDRVSIGRYRCPARPDLAGLLVRPDGYVAWAAGHRDSPARRRTSLLDAPLVRRAGTAAHRASHQPSNTNPRIDRSARTRCAIEMAYRTPRLIAARI